MAWADIPNTKVTIPTFLKDKPNGQLDPAWLRVPDPEAHTSLGYALFVPVSYAMQAMHIAAKRDGIKLRTTGRYRSYVRQVALFTDRYTTTPIPGRPTKFWNGQLWYQKLGVAMAATPGTSNHGRGLADDFAEDDSIPEDSIGESLDAEDIRWLGDHAADFQFGLEQHVEMWHWHWRGGDALNQLVVDTLYAVGILIPDMTEFGFFVPDPTRSPDPQPPKEDDDMPLFLAYTDTRKNADGSDNPKGLKQLWRGNGVEAYSLGDPDQNSPATDAYGLVRRNFSTDLRVKGRYTNPGKTPDDPNAGKVIESADEIPTISPNQVRLDLGTPRSSSV